MASENGSDEKYSCFRINEDTAGCRGVIVDLCPLGHFNAWLHSEPRPLIRTKIYPNR